MLFSKFIFDIIDKATYLSCNRNKIQDITTEKDIVYNNDYKDVCTTDLYYKKRDDKSKYPVLINIHGGGFVAGDKKFRVKFSKEMAEQGLFVITINYGLCPKYKFPIFILQCLSALEWVKNVADKYNLDTDNVLVSGDSAGAYIGAYLGILQSNSELRDKLNISEMPINIKALLLYCGPYEVEKLLSKRIMLNLQAEIGAAFLDVDKQDVIDLAKLENHKYRDILNINPFINSDFPTSFLTFTDHDFLCPDQGKAFLELLQKNNINVRYHNATDKRDLHCYHFFIKSEAGQQAMQDSKKFVKDVLEGNI